LLHAGLIICSKTPSCGIRRSPSSNRRRVWRRSSGSWFSAATQEPRTGAVQQAFVAYGGASAELQPIAELLQVLAPGRGAFPRIVTPDANAGSLMAGS
jgi:hypothetical protein